MKTRSQILILLVLVSTTAVFAYGHYRTHNLSASLISAHASDRLLGHGIWRFDYKIPPGYTDKHFVGLQVRRSKLKTGVGTDSMVSVEDADELLTTSGIGLDVKQTGTVAIQIVDRTNTRNDLLFQGGLQLGGTSSKLRVAEGFVMGKLSATSVDHKPQWTEGEMRLLRVTSTAEDSQYVYDVVLEIRDEPICR